ncbi:MAG TPA: hypothetical protein VKS79_22380 [Gemmataceae bacterium]|nr:hypothetical protein [Gemmataceae bacterium]
MAKKTKKSSRKGRVQMTGWESLATDVPPGATKKAWERPTEPGDGKPGSGGGPWHAAADELSDDEAESREETGDTLGSPPPEEQGPLEKGPPFSGISGGAVGGTPADKRAKGGRARR